MNPATSLSGVAVESPDGSVRASRPGDRPKLLSDSQYRLLLDGYRALLPIDPAIERHLRELLRDALDHPGSLVRAQLAFGTLTGHRRPQSRAVAVAIAVEYFHTASLILDDLPCMDDASERRGRPCPHRIHGEAAATLGALAFVNQAYALLWDVLGPLPAARRGAAARMITSCLGSTGILDGQSRDVHFQDRPHDGGDVLEVARGKTVPLIRLAVVLPALIAGARQSELDRLDRLATLWGLSYQILDDFKDLLLTRRETGKTPARDGLLGRPNFPTAVGRHAAMTQLQAWIGEGRELVDAFPEKRGRWRHLARLQALLEAERGKLAPLVAVSS